MRVRVVMMQRNESDALVRWLSHYSDLFGFENLSIMDNGTTDHFTLEVLRHAESQGVQIYWGLDTQHDFQMKGGHIQNIIGHWDAEGYYDFALPVDCDEIIGVFTQGCLSMDNTAILDEFRSLRHVKCALRIDMSLFNVPERMGWFSPDRHFHKGFLPARSLGVMDNGHHAPESRLAPGYETTRLTYLHWHNRSHAAMIRMARKKLEDLVDVNDHAALLVYERTPAAPGAHLVRILLMSESEYRERYAGDVAISVSQTSGGVNFLLSGNNAFQCWNAERYLEMHPDVRRYTLTPLHHYLRHGYLEGRAIT